ncbi:MAG: zinc-ribbon domain-containing protein, partial [Polyangiaceae bacterium]|nr:zinc-ribbon domain-containing protein [Polyangiaceae bacterium]
MKISCPTCSAKYSLADEKVQNRLAKIRCRKCGTSIIIDGNVEPPTITAGEAEAAPTQQTETAPVAAAEATAASATVYTVDFGESDQRQMTLAEVVAAYNDGAVQAETFLWAEGFADWTALGEVDELVAALHRAAGTDTPDETSSASASTAPQETPWQAEAPGAGEDLFG